MIILYQDRLGTNIGKALKKGGVFPQGVVEMYPPADETILDIGTEEEKTPHKRLLFCCAPFYTKTRSLYIIYNRHYNIL